MNNQNPYPQAPGQPPMPAPGQPPMPAPGQPPMMYPPYPQPVRPKFFNREMVSILGCACSLIGLCMSIAAAVISAALVPIHVLGLIMQILSVFFSAGGFVISLLVGNANVRAGEKRGNFASWGMVFGLVGVFLFLFLIFQASCGVCYASKANWRWPS